ncbi:MAG: GAF domain-containing protein [Chloroflexota bacterium]
MAWTLFAAIFFSTIVAAARNVIGPQEAILLQNLAFTIGFAYVGLASSDEYFSFRRLPQVIANWRMINKLRFVIGTIALPAIVVIGVSVVGFLQSNLINTVGQDLVTLAEAEARNVTNQINNQVISLTTLANNPTIVAFLGTRLDSYSEFDSESIRAAIDEIDEDWQNVDINDTLAQAVLRIGGGAILNNFIETSPEHTSLYIVDRYGALVTYSERPQLYDLSNQEWFQPASELNFGEIYIGFPEFDYDVGQFILEIAIPISPSNVGGGYGGFLLSRYSLESINNELEQVVVGETGGVALFNQQGEWLPTEAAMTQQDPTLNWETILSAENNWLITSYASTDSVIGWADTAATNMANFFELKVVTFIPSQEALSVVTIARNTSIIAFFVLIVVISFVTFTLAAFITNPLSRLTEAAEKVLDGEINVVAEVDGTDEIGTLASTFNSMTMQLTNLVAGLEATVKERTKDLERRAIQMETAAEVAREAAGIQNTQQLLDRAVHLISTRFDFYHTGIFLLDESGEFAVLHSANSEGGQRMLARDHKLQVGKVGVVGYAAGQAEPRIAQDVGADMIYYDNPDMPDTKSEMALPLMARGVVIGVLDVQSTGANAFSKEDVQVLQTLSDQIALAIENARLYQSSQEAVLELEYLYGREVGQSWQKRIDKDPAAFNYSPSGGVNLGKADVLEITDEDQRLTKPINLRGQIIGTLDLVRDGYSRDWTEEEIALIDETIEQTALALESARLSEQIRLRSDQIRLLQEVTALAASTLDISQLLTASTQKMLEGLNLSSCSVILLDEDKTSGTLQAVARSKSYKNDSQLSIGAVFETDNEVTLEVIRTKSTAIIYDFLSRELDHSPIRSLLSNDAKTLVLVPLLVRDEIIGLMNLGINEEDRKLDSEDIDLLDQIGAQIAVAIDIAELFEAEQIARSAAAQRAEREHLVASITAKVRQSNDPQNIIQTAVEELKLALGPKTEPAQTESLVKKGNGSEKTERNK